MLVTKGQNALIKSWTEGVAFEDQAFAQVLNVTSLPFVTSIFIRWLL